jgi:transglutaminase-like putative cysteine protease
MATRKRGKTATSAVAEHYQIPRAAFFWLLAALSSVILPHVGRMPFWLTLTCALCIGGRILIYQGRMSQPGTKTKFALVALMVVLVPIQFGRDIFSTDATVGVLLVGITLKLLEMHQKRDVLIVMYLSYFTVVAEFIYSQSIPIAVYMSFCVLLITAALMSLNQTPEAQAPLRTLKLSGVILLQSVPLMLAFFLLFPRISPLWSVPLQSGAATTGLSENMSPGDIGNLARSADVAFRVLFNGEPPRYPDLYWRALTLDEFDGREWERGYSERGQFMGPDPASTLEWFDDIEYSGSPIDYNVIMEPTFRNWVFTLQVPHFYDDRMVMRRDFTMETLRRVSQRYSYDARSWPQHRLDAEELPALTEARYIRIPRESNPRARQFAAELGAMYPDDSAYIDAVLAHFRDEEFFYTLSPAELGEHPVDEFLFDSREGFCEHYASSFTFLMRAKGIPARVVTGYQGGEFNPYDGTLTVRQYDAHAWSEVWLPDAGWTRVDPTAAVAPERINQGSDQTLQQNDSFLGDEVFTLIQFRDSLFINDLRLRLEMMDYAWNRFVLNYDEDTQFRLFSSLFGNVTRTKIIMVVLGFMALTTLFVGLVVFRKPAVNPLPPATQQYLRFCAYLGKLGFARKPGETPLHYLERVCAANPQWRNDMQAVTKAYVELAFASNDADPAKLKQLRRRVRSFRVMN